MLKIRDDVDLKELEKFGFKPKYDENTGELKEYYKEYCEKIGESLYNEMMNLTYDLITAGLVEKVEEE